MHRYALSLSDEGIGMNVLHKFDTACTTTLSVSVDAACEQLVCGGESKICRMWDVPSASSFNGLASTLTELQGRVDGRSLGAASESAERPPLKFRTSTTIHSVALNAEGIYLAVGTSTSTEIYIIQRTPLSDGSTHVYCEPLLVLDVGANQGRVAFSNTAQLAIGGNQLVSVFDIHTGGMLVKMERKDRVRCVDISQVCFRSAALSLATPRALPSQLVLCTRMRSASRPLGPPQDGACLLVGGFDKQVLLQQIDRGSNLYDFSRESKSVVKGVHLSKDSSMLAMGVEMSGKGAVYLFDVNSSSLKHEWSHDKAVWAVRFHSTLNGAVEAKYLAVGGWDMMLTLYSTTTYEKLQQIKYKPLGGPAFIWSLEWATDGTRLALGCWNQTSYMYAFDPAQLAKTPAQAPLIEICQVKRTDRVYAVATDDKGEFLCVGGRDKRVALYDTDRGDAANGTLVSSPVSAIEMWEVVADDFVYCLALSDDMNYVAFGGTAKKVTVLSALSGTLLFEVPQSGIVWSVALLQTHKGWNMTIGGEMSIISVINVDSESDELQLPVQETTFDISMRQDSIAFCNGHRATLFGASGSHCSWQEKPSFQVVTQVILSLLSVEEQLLRSVQLIIQRHPSCVNSRDDQGSGSLLHFIIDKTNQPELLDKLLSANCRLAMPRDRLGRSPLQLAIQHGKWRSLQLMLDAIIHKKFSISPAPMAVVKENMRDMATKYPLDFLHFISTFELQPEPEVLGEIDASDVMLPSRLLCGDDLRCPKGLWDEHLEANRVKVISTDEEISVRAAALQPTRAPLARSPFPLPRPLPPSRAPLRLPSPRLQIAPRR